MARNWTSHIFFQFSFSSIQIYSGTINPIKEISISSYLFCLLKPWKRIMVVHYNGLFWNIFAKICKKRSTINYIFRSFKSYWCLQEKDEKRIKSVDLFVIEWNIIFNLLTYVPIISNKWEPPMSVIMHTWFDFIDLRDKKDVNLGKCLRN